MVDPNQTAQQNATRMLNEKYGVNNWIKGQRSEFSQIVKWIIRWLKNMDKCKKVYFCLVSFMPNNGKNINLNLGLFSSKKKQNKKLAK